MNEKTDLTNDRFMPEFSNRFVFLLVILAGATLVAVFTSTFFWRDMVAKNLAALPEAIAARMTVEYGIDEFQGNEITDLPTGSKWTMLTLIIINFVLAPAGLLLTWRKLLLDRKRNERGEAKAGRRWPRNLVLVLSGVILGHLAIVNLMEAIIGPAGFRTMIRDNEVDQARSDVIAGLFDAGTNAFQYYFLPKSSGGGGSSFRSNKNKGQPVTLEELGIPATTPAGTYTVKEIRNDTLLVLRGRSGIVLSDGTSPEYEFQVSPGTPSPPEFIISKVN